MSKLSEAWPHIDSGLVRHAVREFELIGGLDQEMNFDMANCCLEIIAKFSKQGHSGFSANYAISMLSRLMKFEPLSALTGEDEEWHEYANGMFQNTRQSNVFKDSKEGEAYWGEGRIFSDDGGKSWVTSIDSRVPIKFPWVKPSEPEKVIRS